MAYAVAGHLPLLHGLEQRALGLGRGAVEFVGEQQLGEHRPGVKAEIARVRLVDGHADDVGRQQVAGELDAAEAQAEGARQAVGEGGLAHARQVLDQQVAARQQAGQRQPYLPGLADDQALDLDDHNPVTHLRIGYVYTQAGKLDEARYHLNRAMEIEPNFPNAMAALGFVHRRIGEKMPNGLDKDALLNEGEGHMIQALKISPMLVDDDGESWWGALGGLYRRRGQVDQAISAYERAAEITPHSSYPFSNLALLYMEKDDREKMLATFKRVERLAFGETQAEVDNYWAYADLLASQLALGKSDEAEHSLRSVIDIAPESSPYVLTMLIDTLTRLTKALGGEGEAPHIRPFIERLREEVAAREERQRAKADKS
mgnify:CR=1 FL=1